MNYTDYFKGKKITLMRIGLLGRGVGDAAFLAEAGAEVLVVDDAPQEVMQSSVDALGGYKNISFKFGSYDLDDFVNCDMVLKGAGTPWDSPEIKEAKKNNIPVEMSTSLFAYLSGARIIGITGSRGKSTVTHLLYETLKKAGKKVHLGGNVLGVSTLAMLPVVSKDDWVVLELDSWQLQGFGEREISPHISIFTNFMPDHMSYYTRDESFEKGMERYWNDKANIFLHQKKGDHLIVGTNIDTERLGATRAEIHTMEKETIPQDWKLQIIGEHNRENVLLAVKAAHIVGVAKDIIKESTEAFKGVAGRLELVREVRGVKVYNDTTATTPTATLAALKALGGERKVILIMGGSDKFLDMSELVLRLKEYTKVIILLPGSGSDILNLEDVGVEVVRVETLNEAVDTAMERARKNDVVILSPAFASFGMFKNEFDRGEQFNELVKNL